MVLTVHSHEYSSRNWLIAAAVLACFLFALYGMQNGAPWYWLLIVILPGLAAAASWFANERSGYRISPSEAYFYQGSDWDLRLRPEQILWASVLPDSDGPDRWQLHLQSGSARELPQYCIGRSSELRQAFETVGIEVRHSALGN